ncbi:LysM peptidoglycan-binding domain-containing protein [Streptomyces sp. NPDC001549]|uniref:LysM peptidoglycan-binding domain-containing protein n=1 Tax=Streptomyces sp. NPDC001549 TaxID=3364586 RepID=UPI0036881EF1
MSVDGVHDAFRIAASTGWLTGDAPAGLADLLASLGVDRLGIRDGQAASGPDSTSLTGTTEYLHTVWTMRLTSTPQPGADRAALVLELNSTEGTWTFKKAFGTLPDSRRPAGDPGGGLDVGESVLGPLILEEPCVYAANEPTGTVRRLSGTLLMRGSPSVPGSDILAPYADFLGDRLYVDGPMSPAPAPVFLDLRAVAPGVRVTLAQLELSAVGLVLTTDFPDPCSVPDQGARRSAVLLFADVTLPTDPAEVATLTGPLLFGDHVWPLSVGFEPPLGLEQGIQALLAMTGGSGSDFTLPPGIAPVNAFGLANLGFGVVPVELGDPGLSYAAVDIRSKEPWDPPMPYLTLDRVGTSWAFSFDTPGRPLVTGKVYGTMRFGQKKASSLGAAAPHAERVARGLLPRTGLDDVVITVELSLPDLGFSAYNVQPFDIPIAQALAAFLGRDGTPIGADLTVESLSINASLLRKDLTAGLTVSGDWSIKAGRVTLALTGLELQIHVLQNSLSGMLVGKGEIAVPDSAPIELLARAQYPGTGAWEFGAIMAGAVDLPRLVYGLLGQEPPAWVNELQFELADLSVQYSTAAGNPYSAAGTLRVRVGEELLGMTIQLQLSATIDRALRTTPADEHLAIALRDTALVDPLTVLTGSLSGTFTINKFEVTASVSVTDAGKDYTFEIAYRDVSLSAATSWTGEGGDRHQILTIRLTGTLGELITDLVSLVNPHATFRLDPPWDFLNSIDLTGLELTIDPAKQKVAVKHDLKLDLGFVKIQSIGLSYDRSTGSPAVNIELDAQLLGDTAAKPLTWDPVTQAPPQPAGLGQKLFSLRYLGLGQHVSVKGLTRYTSISDVVDAMVAAMRPVDPASGKPPIDPATMVFDASSQWLFGIDATFMDTVAVKLVMHDPDLYGILLALRGAQAGSLAGLNVELLYKKVTDDIGVFHARLQIPDAYRQLQFGAVSVTLGVITVDIFANGNFRIDLGFPTGHDFTNSFALEAGIFNGRGGIYFGVLNGATSSRVPRIIDGTFSPVLELGVGLSIGVGRTFQRGPLKADMSVNLVVIFEGVLAWFHPDEGGRSTELYYACRGTVGIVGKLYATVDFKVVRIEVNLQISAMATVELAAHRATVVALNVSVRASASVKILFVKVSFSFSLTLETSFTIGSDSTPPWRLAPGTARRSLTAPSAPAVFVEAEQPPYRLHFDPDAHVFPDGRPRTAHLTLVPGYTIANVPVDWTGRTPPPNDEPDHRLVVMLLADNAVPVDAVTIARTERPDVSRNARADGPADTSFNRLAEGLLRWSIDALGVTSPTVTLGELLELVEQLALAEAENVGFTWANIQGFLANNLHLVVSGTPAGDTPDDVSGTPFPMIPVLKWTSTGLPDPADKDRDFAAYRQIDATYEAGALAYFAELDPVPPGERPSSRAGADEPSESMATFVLRDYLRMVARAGAQAAVNLLTAFPHEVTETDSLRSIAAGFGPTTTPHVVATRDTTDHIASALGVSTAELSALNPGLPDRLAAARAGDTLTVALGVTPQSIAVANPDWPVVADTAVTLGTLPVQLGASQTLGQLADTYQADPTTLLDHLRDTTPLLRAGATVPLPGFVHTGLSVDDTAAVFYVRLGLTLPDDVPLADWYQQAIDRLGGNPGHPLPPTLLVPDGYQSTTTITWTTLPGDTVLDVAAYAALIQNVVPGTPFADWLEAVRTANEPADPDGVRLPADAAAVVLPNDTLRSLQERLLLPAARFDAYAAAADALVALVTVDVPGAVGTTTCGLTLLTLAQKYGLGLEDLAERIADDTGVLATRENRLTVPGVPEMALDELVAAMHDGAAMATVSGQVARFMLGGLRLPAPVPVDGTYRAVGPMTGGYELIGQQVTGPPPPAESEDPVVTITVAKAVAADWLTFAGSEVHEGVIRLDAAEAGHAVISITAADLRDNYPAAGLAPVVESPLAALPLSHGIGTRPALAQMIPWQTTTTVRLPVAPSGPPSLWPLPSDLIARAGSDRSSSEFLLEQTTPQTGADARYTELGSYAWATLVSFAVRRIPGLAGTVEVLGADTADRQRIAQILEYLRAIPEKPATGAYPPAPPGESLLLTPLWQLPPSPGLTPGLTSTPLDADRTFIVQTNLSTETRSGPTSQDATSGQHFAAIADGERFLTLLWECSVVGGGGYWMQYRGEVPDSIFDQDGHTRLSLLVQLSSQCGAEPDRHLYAFTDVAVVGDGVDPASVALSARAVNPPELRPVASVTPGQVGFTARFANPLADDTPQGRLRRLYGLLGFQLDRTQWFRGSVEGRAVSPKPADGTDELGLLAPGEAAEEVWDLTRIIDISRFAAQRAEAVPTAPPPDADPYAGIAAGARTQVSVWFEDVFGNRSGTPDQTAVPVRYTDPVIGVGAWPSTTLRYGVAPAGDLAELAVAVDLQTIAYQPGAAEAGGSAAAAAERDQSRLVPVYYQVSQPDVRAVLLTSLQQQPGSDATPLALDVNVLRRYVIGAHALLGSLATIGPAPATGATTLDAVCTAYGVGFDDLGGANADTAISAMLDADELVVPVSAAFRNGDTIAGLCHAVDPPLDPEQVLLDEDNTVLPLNPAVELVTPPRDAVVPPDSPPADELAAALRCSLRTLVTANQERAGLLTPGFVFECAGAKVQVAFDRPASEATLAGVTSAFQGMGVPFDATQVVSLNADKPGMFRAGASLEVAGYLVEGGDTLRDNREGLTPEQLAPLNTATVDLFTPGTPVLLATTPTPVPQGDTLGQFAAVNGTTTGALLRHNGSVEVLADSPPAVPGTWAWPADPDALRVPYTVREGDSLDGIAAHFPGADLIVVNAEMPGTIASDVTVTVGGETVTTTAYASFAEVCALFSPPIDLAALADAIGERTDVPATGALLVCPPGVLPGQPAAVGVTPQAAAQPFGVTALALLAANAGTPGLLLPGQVLRARQPGTDGTVPTETTAASDTLTAVVARFHRRGVVTGVDAIVAANAGTGFLRAGARVVVPPATALLTGRLGESTPDGVQWSFPEPVFPVTVALELSREPELVDPALAATATRDRTVVPAARGADPAQDGALTLAAFAEQVQRAVPVLRLATAPGRTSDTDVWAVVFDAEGIERVRIEPPCEIAGTRQPRAFALRPLSTTLMARRHVTTSGFDVHTGELTEGQVSDYQGIDLEVWARAFLADAELLLSAAYVQGAYALRRDVLDGIIGVKKTLAAAVAEGLHYVLAGEAPDAGPDPKRAAAVERLRQELLVSLTRGYATSAVVQYDTSASSPWAAPYARLSGNPVVDYRDVPAHLRTVTVSNGKVSLADGDSQISFLITVPDVAAHAALDLTLDFAGVELEFGIEREVEGYERSDWLTFVTPLASGSPPALDFDLGAPRVPVPLRAYPPMPILLDQHADVPTRADGLGDALYWKYRFSVQHQSAEQDTVELRVAFNQSAGTAVAAADDLFAALAQYTAVSAPMLGLLAGLTDWEHADADRRTALANALGTYRTLASAVADAWAAHWENGVAPSPTLAAASADGPVPDIYRYAFGLDAQDGWYTTLRLTRTVERGPGGVGWPESVCVIVDGKRHELEPADPELCGCTAAFADAEHCRCFVFPLPVEAFALLTFELTFPPVHIAAYQNASAHTRVTRNARLLGEGWPDTEPAFVYRTPEVGHSEPVVPFIDITGAIPIGPWDPHGDNPLGPMFGVVFDGDPAGRTVAIGARYAYTLVAGAPPVSALLPVVQSTVGTYDTTTVPTLTQALVEWSEREQPATEGGAWAFRVSLYSSVDRSLRRPVLQLKRLSSELWDR